MSSLTLIRLKKIAVALLVGVIFYFLFRNIVTYWEQVSAHLADINLYFLLWATITYILYCLAQVQLWRIVLGKFNLYLGYLSTLRIWISSMMGRYVPVGKGLALVGQVWLANKEGLPKLPVLASTYLTLIANIFSGFLWGIITMGGIEGDKLWFHNPIYIFILAVVLLLLFQPKILSKVLNWTLKLLKKEPVNMEITTGDLWQILGLFMIIWSLMGMSVYCAICSLHPLSIKLIPLVTGIYALAWVLGILTLFAPGGLGVREGALAYLLSRYIPLPLAALIAILSRLIFILGELIILLISWGLSLVEIRGNVSEDRCHGED